MPDEPQNFLSLQDIANLCDLAGFELIKRDWRQLVPRRLLGLGRAINRYVGTCRASGRWRCATIWWRARCPSAGDDPPRSVSVVIPCRNERGNIEPAVRAPAGDGASGWRSSSSRATARDDTWTRSSASTAAHPELDIKVLEQDGNGKGNAVRKGFDRRSGDVLMILDADLTVPPEELPKFWQALASGTASSSTAAGWSIRWSTNSMRFLNHVANKAFSHLFTWLLNQRFTDTLCGTKAISRDDYRRLAANRGFFGDFDPFGDFDLIFGASRLNLKTVEIPIRYQSRAYGSTQISASATAWCWPAWCCSPIAS